MIDIDLTRTRVVIIDDPVDEELTVEQKAAVEKWMIERFEKMFIGSLLYGEPAGLFGQATKGLLG